MRDQRVWSVVECAEIFRRSITELKQHLVNTTVTNSDDDCTAAPAMLVWDKVIDMLATPLHWSLKHCLCHRLVVCVFNTAKSYDNIQKYFYNALNSRDKSA